VFLLLKGETEGRLDPKYAIRERFIAKYPKQKLGDLLREKPMYGANESAVEANRHKDIRYLRITDIDEFGNLKDTDWKTAQTVDEKYLLNPNDIVFARTGATAGKALIFRKEMPKSIFAGYLIKFVVDSDKVNPEYIFYYTQTNVYQSWVNSIQRPSGQPNINSEEFKSLEIPIPDGITQQTIINIFEQAYATKKANEAQAKALLASIDEYLLKELGITLPDKQENSLKNRVFLRNISELSGERVDANYWYNLNFLSSLVGHFENVSFKSILREHPQYGANQSAIHYVSGEKIRYIRITDINELGELIEEDWKTASVIEERYLLEAGDLLFARSGATAGKCLLYKSEHQKSIFAGYLIRFKVDMGQVLPEYIFYFTQTFLYKHWVKTIQRTSAQPNINSQEYMNLQIPLPPLEIQEKIVVEIQKIREQAQTLQNEAKAVLEQAKIKVEKMILEGGNDD
jgi:restriction endonuclease S subunit